MFMEQLSMKTYQNIHGIIGPLQLHVEPYYIIETLLCLRAFCHVTQNVRNVCGHYNPSDPDRVILIIITARGNDSDRDKFRHGVMEWWLRLSHEDVFVGGWIITLQTACLSWVCLLLVSPSIPHTRCTHHLSSRCRANSACFFSFSSPGDEKSKAAIRLPPLAAISLQTHHRSISAGLLQFHCDS